MLFQAGFNLHHPTLIFPFAFAFISACTMTPRLQGPLDNTALLHHFLSSACLVAAAAVVC